MENLVNNFDHFPRHVKTFVLLFTLSLTFGYFTGFDLIYLTTDFSSNGIVENYVGNEDDEDADILKFKKSEKEILTIIHTHVTSFALIFLSLGLILLTIPLNSSIKRFLMLEPFISVILTFGSIWFLWKGYDFFKYIAMISGFLLTASFVVIVAIITRRTFKAQSG